MKFTKGEYYTLSYFRTEVTRHWNGRPCEWDKKHYHGSYEYRGPKGGKLHFYNFNTGVDVLLTKTEAIEAYKPTLL